MVVGGRRQIHFLKIAVTCFSTTRSVITSSADHLEARRLEHGAGACESLGGHPTISTVFTASRLSRTERGAMVGIAAPAAGGYPALQTPAARMVQSESR